MPLQFIKLEDMSEIELKLNYEKISKLIDQHPSYRKNPYVIFHNENVIGYSFTFIYGGILKVLLNLDHELNIDEGKQLTIHLHNKAISGFDNEFFYIESWNTSKPYHHFLTPIDSIRTMERKVDLPIFETDLPKEFMINSSVNGSINGSINGFKIKKIEIAGFLELCYEDDDNEYFYRNYGEQIAEFQREKHRIILDIYDRKNVRENDRENDRGNDRGKLVAICLCVIDESSKYIDHICVHPEYRHQGLGQILLNKLINFQAHLPINLDVYKSNKIALKFYRKNFFSVNEENSFVLKR